MNDLKAARPSSRELAAHARMRVRRIFADAQWQVREPGGRELSADLIVTRGALQYVIEVKAVPRGNSMGL